MLKPNHRECETQTKIILYLKRMKKRGPYTQRSERLKGKNIAIPNELSNFNLIHTQHEVIIHLHVIHSMPYWMKKHKQHHRVWHGLYRECMDECNEGNFEPETTTSKLKLQKMHIVFSSLFHNFFVCVFAFCFFVFGFIETAYASSNCDCSSEHIETAAAATSYFYYCYYFMCFCCCRINAKRKNRWLFLMLLFWSSLSRWWWWASTQSLLL